MSRATTGATMPTWLRAHLVADGVMTPGGITGNAKPRHCRQGCGLLTLAGIDDLGFIARAHPIPTTTLGELLAVMAGRRSWTLIAGMLVYRGRWRITAHDADSEPAYVEHECGEIPEINWLHFRPRISTYEETPPF